MTNNAAQIRASIDALFPKGPKRPFKASAEMIKYREDRHKTDEHRLNLQEEAEIAKETAEVWDE